MNVPAPPGGLWPRFPYPPGPADTSLPCPLCEDPLGSRVTMAVSGGGPRASTQDSHPLWKWDKGPESLPSLAQSLAGPRPLTHAVPAGGRGLEALVTQAAEGALRVVAEAVAPAHRVVGTLVYVCGTGRREWRVCSHAPSLPPGHTY